MVKQCPKTRFQFFNPHTNLLPECLGYTPRVIIPHIGACGVPTSLNLTKPFFCKYYYQEWYPAIFRAFPVIFPRILSSICRIRSLERTRASPTSISVCFSSPSVLKCFIILFYDHQPAENSAAAAMVSEVIFSLSSEDVSEILIFPSRVMTASF